VRKNRVIYYNDARHWYLFVFEPPMKMEEAHRPIDELVGTGVTTFAYGVERGDGLFYPSKAGERFGTDMVGQFRQAAYWRLWHCMQSLIDRGLDPLTVLIDRAHEKGMEFIASARLGSYLGMDDSLSTNNDGPGFMDKGVRDHVFKVLRELAEDYATDGIELDLAAPPGGSPFLFKEDQREEGIPVATDWVREVSKMASARSSGPAIVGARVYPTESMNRAAGYDVRAWLSEGMLDYVIPMRYSHHLDMHMEIEWLSEAASAADVSVYPMLNTSWKPETRAFATGAMMRAAASNYWHMGADGFCSWGLNWPLGDEERRILADWSDPVSVDETDKHYVMLREANPDSKALPYPAPLPFKIESDDIGTRHKIPFHVGDDVAGKADRIRSIQLRIRIGDLVSEDKLEILLNGQSLAGETCERSYGHPVAPYLGQWLEFDLRNVRPRQGRNLLEISLQGRPKDLLSPLEVDEAHLIVKYGSYPTGLYPR
jgi:hypothetical protein